MYAQVVVDVLSRQVDKPFTYAVPDGLSPALGMRVRVPFGKRELTGLVVGLCEEAGGLEPEKIKPLLGAVEDFPLLTEELIALAKAEEANLDLVKISPQANPPVCKLMDYGKYRFEQGKREKEARKNQHVVEIKEIRMSPGIDIGDFNVKLKNAQKFLTDGNRVKVSVRFRGREMAHTDIGKKLLDKFAEQCAEVSSVDKGAKLEGRNMSMFLSPKK